MLWLASSLVNPVIVPPDRDDTKLLFFSLFPKIRRLALLQQITQCVNFFQVRGLFYLHGMKNNLVKKRDFPDVFFVLFRIGLFDRLYPTRHENPRAGIGCGLNA